jgi:hypothetical protein
MGHVFHIVVKEIYFLIIVYIFQGYQTTTEKGAYDECISHF